MIIMEEIKRSGVNGVLWHKRGSKWKVGIVLHKKNHHLGLFEDIDDAVMARYIGELIYHREYNYETTLAKKYLIKKGLL